MRNNTRDIAISICFMGSACGDAVEGAHGASAALILYIYLHLICDSARLELVFWCYNGSLF